MTAVGAKEARCWQIASHGHRRETGRDGRSLEMEPQSTCRRGPFLAEQTTSEKDRAAGTPHAGSCPPCPVHTSPLRSHGARARKEPQNMCRLRRPTPRAHGRGKTSSILGPPGTSAKLIPQKGKAPSEPTDEPKPKEDRGPRARRECPHGNP